MTSLTFKLNIPLSFIFLLLFPILISLGFWQLNRAEEKTEILRELQEIKQLPAANWENKGLQSGRLIKVNGQFNSKQYWLLDNKIYRGKVGFEVIMPFYTKGKVALVNRGWVQGDLARRELPKFETPVQEVTITGRVHKNSKNVLIDYQSSSTWPKVISRVSIEEMMKDLAGAELDHIIRLQSDSPAALPSDWPAVNVLPQKHTAYAVQWFAMALALLLMYLIYSTNILRVVGFSKASDSDI